VALTPADDAELLISSIEAGLPGDGEALTLAQTAEVLAISVATAKKLAARGELPGVLPKVGHQWRVSRRVLATFLAGGAMPTEWPE
jgi:excisionase family DNA binding protein